MSDFVDVGDASEADGGVLSRQRASCEARGGAPAEDQKIQKTAAVEAERAANAALLPGGNAPAGTPTWRSLGPTRNNWWTNGTIRVAESNSGRMRQVIQDPTQPDTVYALTSGGGLWRTDDFSHPKPDWRPLTDGVISTSGGALALGRDPGTLYLGVGDPFDPGSGAVTGVVVKSTDGGAHWSPFSNLAGAVSVMDLKVDTSQSADVVLVGTDNGLFRSTDGVSYAQVASNAGEPFAQRIVWSLARTSAGWIAATHSLVAPFSATLALSTDRGATWTTVAAPLFANAGRVTLAMANPGESVVYALATTPFDFNGSNGSQFDILKSTDGGVTWTALGVTGQAPTNPNADQPLMNLIDPQAFYNHMLLVDPSDAARQTLYFGGALSTAKSTDGGASWTLLSNWLGEFNLPWVHADAQTAAALTVSGRNVIAFGTDGGLFITLDGGRSFSAAKNQGIVASLMYSIASSGVDSQRLLAGLQDDGTMLRLPNQTTWNGVIGGDGLGTGWSQANDATALGSVVGSHIRRSVNNPPTTPQKWEPGSHGIGGPDLYYFFTAIHTPTAAADPTGQVFFHKTGLKIYRTVDGAASWQPIAVSTVFGVYPNGNISCILNSNMHNFTTLTTDAGHVAAGCNAGAIVLTRNGGATWRRSSIRSVRFPGYTGVSGVAWPTDQLIYVSSIVPGVPVVKSTDGGVTWARATAGLPFVAIERLLAEPNDPTGDTVYAATEVGVYRTTNGGASWSRFGAGMPMVVVRDLAVSADGLWLRAATYGRGAWEIAR